MLTRIHEPIIMKRLLLFCGLLLMAGTTPVLARRCAPADTVAGHARIVRQLSEAMCAQLSSDHTTKFEALSTPEAMQMTQQLFITAMQRDSVAFMGMMTAAVAEGKEARAVGEVIGRDVVLRLGKMCPAAMPLILRISQTDQAKQAAAARLPVISDAERKCLQPLSANICAGIAAADAKQPFAKLQPAQRHVLFAGLMQQAFVAGRPHLLRYYSAAQLNDPKRREEIGQKLAGLMLQQTNCANYLLLIGTDEISK